MAKVKMPLLSGQVSGKIGDIVFFRRGDFDINVARMRVVPSNPNTTKQQTVRHNIKTLTKIYSGRISPANAILYRWVNGQWVEIKIASDETFTDDDKKAWDTFLVVTKQGYKVRGRLAFISHNLNALRAGDTPYKRPNVKFRLT